MIRNAEVGCRLRVARDALVDVPICYAVDLADAPRGRLVCIGLSPGACRHADSVKGGTCWLRDGMRPPADKVAAMRAPALGQWALNDQRRPPPSMPPSMSRMDPAPDCPAPPPAAPPPSIEFSMSLSGLADPVAPPKGLFWPPPPP